MQREQFETLASALLTQTKSDERIGMWLEAEHSHFVRFNKAKIRQPGTVQQAFVTLDLCWKQRRAFYRLGLSGDAQQDQSALSKALQHLRDEIPHFEADPHLLVNDSVQNSEAIEHQEPIEHHAIVETILESGAGTDLVGIYAAGPIIYGYANNLGQRNWFEKSSINIDWSLYHQADKAVKTSWSGYSWDSASFAKAMQEAKHSLELLRRPAKTLSPGDYRAFLAPAALAEIFQLMAWNGFGQESIATKQSPLGPLADRTESLHTSVSLEENIEQSAGPNFQADGFLKHPRTSLIEHGQFKQSLVSPRSAKKYGLKTTGSSNAESPESLQMQAGTLPDEQRAKALDTGLWINNLWYLNYSDRSQGKMTGMTRFATLWVENGEPVAPVNVMRFDDSIYAMLGQHLEALTKQRAFMLDTGTYEKRSTHSMLLPGALLSKLSLTL